MLPYITLSVVFACVVAVPQAKPGAPVTQEPQGIQGTQGEARQLLYYGGFQNQPVLLEPQFQVPYIINEKQSFPRLQPPQFYIYQGGVPPGQQFLLQPGAPPGNFLLPQPQPQPQPQPIGPGIILRDAPPTRPLFIAGYPKPAHIPPVEKDAEEIPTDPAKIPKPAERKPEKLETFNEDKNDDSKPPVATEQDGLAAADRNPVDINKKFFQGNNINEILKPGQRFFFLNGQNLFPNYPYQQQPQFYPQAQLETRLQNMPLPNYPNYPLPSYNYRTNNIPNHAQQKSPLNHLPLEFFIRNSVTGQIDDVNPELQNTLGGFNLESKLSQNYISLNKPQDHRDTVIVTGSLPIQFAQSFRKENIANPPKDTKGQLKPEVKHEEKKILPLKHQQDAGYYQYQYDRGNSDNIDDSVVIDAKFQNDDSESEDIIAADKVEEPSVSQAQPGAIALAGPGGTAAAAPRGTALVGQGGLAVSSPQATAVAGPSKEDQQGTTQRSRSKPRPKKERE